MLDLVKKFSSYRKLDKNIHFIKLCKDEEIKSVVFLRVWGNKHEPIFLFATKIEEGLDEYDLGSLFDGDYLQEVTNEIYRLLTGKRCPSLSDESFNIWYLGRIIRYANIEDFFCL